MGYDFKEETNNKKILVPALDVIAGGKNDWYRDPETYYTQNGPTDPIVAKTVNKILHVAPRAKSFKEASDILSFTGCRQLVTAQVITSIFHRHVAVTNDMFELRYREEEIILDISQVYFDTLRRRAHSRLQRDVLYGPKGLIGIQAFRGPLGLDFQDEETPVNENLSEKAK